MRPTNLDKRVCCASCRWSGMEKSLGSKLLDLNGTTKSHKSVIKTPCCPNCKSTDLVYKDGIFIK